MDYQTWIEPRQWKKTVRQAEREVRKIEQALGGPGSLDIPTPDYEWLTLRQRVLIRVQRGEEIPFCQVCGRPYIIDGPRRAPTCSKRCTEIHGQRQRAAREAISKYAGQYDPRVDVRLRLGLSIKMCKECGKPFPDYHPRRKYCSDRCRKNAWYARHPLRHCAECGIEFRGRSRTCSKRCARRRRYHHKMHGAQEGAILVKLPERLSVRVR